MAALELLTYRVAGGALKAITESAMRSTMAPKSGALIVSRGSTGRLRNRLFPTVSITEGDIKSFEKHVLSTISPLLATEFKELPPNEKEAAIEAVAQAYAKSTADAFDFDFDPEKYATHIKKNFENELSTMRLGEPAEQLYSRIVHEVAAQALNFITTWPSFLARASVENLKRMTQLAKDLEKVRKSVIDDATREEIDFEERYAGVIIEKLDQLELFGVTVSDDTQRTYPLSTAYISLSVTESSVRGRPASEAEQIAPPIATESRNLEDAVGGLRSESAISNFDRIMLRGDAGSGKTTLLHWLAVNSMRRSLEGEMHTFNGYVPFVIPLRRFADRPLPVAHEFLSETGRHLTGEMPNSWVNRVLRSGQAFVLIDGVDELPETRRDEAKEWLTELLAAYPTARYIVTSRPGAAQEEWLKRENFTSVDMLPMSSSDIASFIQHWHESARSCLPDTVDERQLEELDDFENELLSAIRQQPQLRRLASNPLLCALLCTLSRDRRMQLPQGRMELYAAALEMLLVRRDAERKIKHSDSPIMTLVQKQRILGVFAYWLLRNKLTDSTKEQAVSQIEIALKSMPAVQATGRDVYKYLMVRSGLLRQPVEGRVDFIHRTFQEYLAADTLINQNDIGALVQNAHLDQWHEVVTMAVGHARPLERAEILQNLLDRGDAETENRTRLHLLAGACLENADQLDEGTFELVRRKVSALIPPSKVADAKELAAVGPMALNLLPRTLRNLYAGQAAACVRTASLVGGEAAMDIMSGYATDSRKMVYKELARAWRQFDVEEYAERVISRSPLSQRSLIVDNPELLVGVKYLSRLRSLECQSYVPNLDWIIDAPQLRSLALGRLDTGTDLSPLAKFIALTELGMGFSGPLDEGVLRWMDQLTELRDLRLAHPGETVPIEPRYIPVLPTLKRLSVSGYKVTMSGIADSLPSLAHLHFLFSDTIDFSGVERLSSLRSLRVYNSSTLVNCEALNSLENLDELTLLNVTQETLSEAAKIRNVPKFAVFPRGPMRAELDLSAFVDHPSVRITVPSTMKILPSAEALGDRLLVHQVRRPHSQGDVD
ncbi:NACHT domain-containing protein [Streptomyces sp. NPDC058052]|uniref:NACHT domain-containing protein n=1 Tax=Streptomyces sp. NPDC058052 TaxID=3346316 RepID=UPI0036E10D31